MSRKLKASCKVTVKYSRDGLTEQNLADKTETVISNKTADMTFGKHSGSEFQMRSQNSVVQDIHSNNAKRSIAAFNVMNDKGLKENLSSLAFLLPDNYKTVTSSTDKNRFKGIKPKLDTPHTIENSPKKEYIRQQPKSGGNFKPKRQSPDIPKSENHLKPAPLLKFSGDKQSLMIDETDRKGRLKFKDEVQTEPSGQDGNSNKQTDDNKGTENGLTRTLKFSKTVARQPVKAVKRTLKQNHMRLQFKKSQQTGSHGIREVMQKLMSENDDISNRQKTDSTTNNHRDLNVNTEKRDINFQSEKYQMSYSKNSSFQKQYGTFPKSSKLMFKPDEKTVSDIRKSGKQREIVPVENPAHQHLEEKPLPYLKAEKKADKEMTRLEKAESKQPTHKVLKHESIYDDKKGKARHRLYFEEEKKPPRKQYLSKELPKVAVSAAVLEVKGKVHQKLYQAENDNSAVKAAHRTELIAERSSNAAFRYAIKWHRDKPYRLQRKVDRLKYKAEKANRRLLFEKAAHENPQLKRSIRKRTQYKQFIKQKYKQQMRSYAQKKSAKKAAQKTAAVIKEFITVKNKGYLILVLIVVLMAFVLCSLFAVTLTSMTGSIVNEYTSSDDEISNVASAWQALEDGLQNEIDNIETEYLGYNRYVYDIDTIGADKKKILAYFSAKYKKIVYADHSTDIESFFNELYVYSLVSYTDGDYSVLQIELHVNDLDTLIESNLTDEEKQAYGAYLEIFQNSQDYNEIIENVGI